MKKDLDVTTKLSITFLLSFLFVGCATNGTLNLNDKTQLPRQLVVEENYLIDCCTPVVTDLLPISESQLKNVFSLVKKYNIEYRYINGSCEDRAHFISLILKKHGVETGKVWVLAPSRYTLLSPRRDIVVEDPYREGKNVSWGYHVAPYVEVLENGKPQKYVFDLSFSPETALSLNNWLLKINTPEAVYIFSESSSYLFNSLNGLRVYDNNRLASPEPNPVKNVILPIWLPNIVTGDFYNYDPVQNRIEVAKGMAVNDTAAIAYYDYVSGGDSSLDSLLDEIDDFEAYLEGKQTFEIDQSVTLSLQEIFLKRQKYWEEKISELDE